MSERRDLICLTPEEIDGLRELLAVCAVIEDRGFRDKRQMIEVTAQTWRGMMEGPKRKLARLTRYRALTP